MRNTRSILAACTAAATVVGFVAVTSANAASTTAVVNEVYGGGGNTGAVLTNDFVELKNVSGSDVALTGYSVQYAPSSGSSWQVTSLSGSVPTGDTYLVGEASGGANGSPLPPTDATGTINMSASSGTIALVHSTSALTCHTAPDCAADPSIIDLVGYGAAVICETSDAPGLSATTSAQRAASGADTDNNGADFAAGAPSPQGTGGTTPPPTTPVHDIQGAGFLSPLDNQHVSNVPGIVTGVRTSSSRGFWLQDQNPDADPATSEGIFVFTSSTPTVSVGDSVTVDGTVSEFYPGGAPSTNSNLSVTEIDSPTVTPVSTGNPLPAPVALGPDNVPDLYAPDNGGNSIENMTLDPTRSALEFYESLEGMRVEIDDARVVGPSNSFGEQYVTSRPEQDPTYRGGTQLLGENQTPSGRLEVVAADGSNPNVDVNDVFQGATIGPMDYSAFGGYVLAATTVGTVVHNNLPRIVATPPAAGQVSVATYNVENLAPGDPAAKYQQLAQGIVSNLRSPDIVALEEVQDNSGATDDGVVAADQTLTNLTQAITMAGGPTYSWREIDPVNDKDGGQPGGNIRVAFLFNPGRVSFVDSGDASVNRSVTGTEVVKDHKKVRLSLSPGRIDPTNPVWNDSRKPLVGQFRVGTEDVFVIANHFDSKLGDQNADGRFQYPERSSEVQRAGQALVVHDFVNSILALKRDAEVVVLGDLNDYQFSPALNVLRTGNAGGTGTPNLTDLITTLPVNQQYTYVFDGISQVLDHILATNQIGNFRYQVIHLNAEYHDQVSDHDPQVVQFRP